VPHTLAPLDARAAQPYYRQVYERFRSAIVTGALKPGDRIPSARALTKELGLARGTVDTAYALLVAEGYLETRGQAGTIVAPGLKLPASAALVAPKPRRITATSFRPDTVLPFQMGLPALDAFPRKLWARIGARMARATQPMDLVHPPVAGLPELRDQIAAYLQVSRGIACSAAQVFISSGYRHSLELVVHALLKPGDRALVEDPGYPPTRELLAGMGIASVPVPVDRDGMLVAAGLQRAPEAKVAVVTPAHQSPLGVALALPRRLALLEWASATGSWIVEDDYDGEYRYVSRPLPALKSLDRDDRVLYAGTFSKVLFPSLRLAYLVVPAAEVERFEAVTQTFVGGSPGLTQAIVASFIAEGHFARHVQRMRRLYAARRRDTVAGLEQALGRLLRIDPQPGGMHLILRLDDDIADRELVGRMLDDGLYAEALSDWRVKAEAGEAILINFTNVESAARAEALGQRIARLIMA